jgi:hypothetical protein
MTDATSGIALKVGIEVLNRVTPKGYAWVKSKIVGRDILVVGQARAGKTSLQRYLQYGLRRITRALERLWSQIARDDSGASFNYGSGA